MTARAILLTSQALRHRFVANQLAVRLDLVGIWQETKAFEPLRAAGSDAERGIIEAHFAARDQAEDAYFSGHADLRHAPPVVLRAVAAGGINEPDEIRRMIACRPEVVSVFGAGLLCSELISAFPGRIVNLHLGLSPYYRGSGTNFWPLVNREPEYVGATLHYLNSGIDTGPIIGHVRPAIARGDGPHDLGNKTIREAASALAECVEAVARGGVEGIPQTVRGRLYQRKDFTAVAVTRLYDNFRTGMLDEYLADKASRDAKLELVSCLGAR